ncbi:GntR family transcriptional regulator [Microbacterium sp. CPCC 204701]|uniref:GntR family transcriptional regulator n=1 Tax=Microbacterium sp. CPCC 204701 TaxID=2493084 RepID=UPI000FD7851C|nr:GntR family transcriptional regulator [Microbacterium sp. CPCC 204701]
MTAPFVAIEPRRTVLCDEVYARLGEAILDGRLAPGEQLRDQELAERLGVSRTPVREALQRLARTGLVEVSPNRYTRVSIPDAPLLKETHEFVVLMLGNIVRLAVARCSDDELGVLVGKLDDVIAASRDDDRLGIIDRSATFFASLTRAASNRAYVVVMREAEFVIRRNLAGWHPFIECPIRRSEAYERLRDALLARDADWAERALRAQHGLD